MWSECLFGLIEEAGPGTAAVAVAVRPVAVYAFCGVRSSGVRFVFCGVLPGEMLAPPSAKRTKGKNLSSYLFRRYCGGVLFLAQGSPQGEMCFFSHVDVRRS